MPGRRRILQEAKASGKAWGYADVKTTCSKDKAVSSSQVVNTSDLESNEWAQTPWRKLEQYVFQLQKRIYRARQRGDWKTVRGLQRLLRRSRAARTLAVRRVTQDNSGKNTPGIDGVAKLTPKERLEMVQTMNLSDKARPVRRVWIPKPGQTEMRPLGIPTGRVSKVEMTIFLHCPSKGIAVDKQANDDVMHLCRFRKADSL